MARYGRGAPTGTDSSATAPPILVSHPSRSRGLTNIVAIAAGAYHSLALKADGTVWSWGNNGNGQLGNGSTMDGTSPVQVSGLTNATAIGAGYSHSLARLVDGSVRAWGANSSGQLGTGNFTQRTSPATVSSLADVVSISAGSYFSLALKSNGTLWSWGDNSEGQLGTGGSSDAHTPAQISTLSTIAMVRAGSDHALALSSTGALHAWGANDAGQLGDGTTTQRSMPVAISTLPALSEIAGGGAFSLGLTTGGQLWAWGQNYYGQFGDGTTMSAIAPVDITEAGLVWRVATPQFSSEPGTYESDLSLTITSDTAGAAIHYTNDGSAPNESSPLVPAGGVITLNDTTTLRAKAFLTGQPASRTAEAAYVLQVAQPTFSPPAGLFGVAQTVSIRTRTNGAVIRYTTNGSEPTPSSPTYSAPIVVDQSLTLRAIAYRSGSIPSETASADYALRVPSPVAMPVPGKYQSTQTVTLTGVGGAVIRYTTDGTEPTGSSPIYTSPLTASGLTTIAAKAFIAGWMDSETLHATYEIDTDTTDPTIRAVITPAPNLAGWNDTPVTVSFVCEDDFAEPLQCTAPVALSAEGAGQVVTGTVLDGAGHSVQLQVTVNIDLTPAALTISAPASGATTSATTIAVTGMVSDALSGLGTLRCNGAVVTPGSGGSFSCDAALGKGRNTVLVQVADVAGHQTAVPIAVTRTGTPVELSVAPSSLTLLVGQERTLRATDDFGTTPTTVSWTTSDATVIDVVAGPPGRIRAMSAGTATVTATAGSLSAEATITVASGVTIQVGTLAWSVAPALPGGTTLSVHAHKIDDTGPDIYVLEESGGTYLLRGLRADGLEVSRDALPFLGSSDQVGSLVGDNYGGVLMQVNHCDGSESDRAGCASIVRAGGGSVSNWSYRTSADSLDGDFVQNSVGDIFFLEFRLDSEGYINGTYHQRSTSHLVRLNGTTGAVTSRYNLPRSHTVSRHCEWSGVNDTSATVSSLVVGADDSLYALVFPTFQVSDFPTCDAYHFQVEKSLQMLKVSPSGGLSSTSLEQFSDSGSDSTGKVPPSWPANLAPDGQGGILAWSGSDNWDPEHPTQAMYIDGSSHEWLADDFLQNPLVGRDGTYYGQLVNGFGAINPSTQTTLYTTSMGGTPVAARENGSVALESDGLLYLINSSGGIESAQPMPTTGSQYWSVGEWHAGANSMPYALHGPMISDETYYYAEAGNLQGQRRGRLPSIVNYVPVPMLREGQFAWSSAEFADEFEDAVFPYRATRRTLITSEAKLVSFFGQVQDATFSLNMASPVEAVGLIAHAVYQTNQVPYYSVGLEFWDRDLIKQWDPIPPPQGRQWINPKQGRGEATAWWVDRVRSQTKIIFVASCYVGPEFQDLWGISMGTTGRALVVPVDQALTFLDVGADAWKTIAPKLAAGMPIGQAVQEWNDVSNYDWKVIGDTTLQIAATPRP